MLQLFLSAANIRTFSVTAKTFDQNLLVKSNRVEANINAFMESGHVELINPAFHFNLIAADRDDNKFVDCAIMANARYIVTNDHHYDVLRQIDFPKVGVIKLIDFRLMIHGSLGH